MSLPRTRPQSGGGGRSIRSWEGSAGQGLLGTRGAPTNSPVLVAAWLSPEPECGRLGRGLQAPPKDPLPAVPQDCLRACQEQIEGLLECSLRQAQQDTDPKATEEEEEEQQAAAADLACTPTDVRDVDV